MGFFQNFTSHRGLIAAHRGARSERPENTLCAFQAAIGRCDYIEVDIQLSKDAVPVIVHDEQLSRTTDITQRKQFAHRKPWLIYEMNLLELKALDMGSWFLHDDPFGTVQSGAVEASTLRKMMPQRIMTLEEFLSFVVKNRLWVNLEVKDLRGTPHDATAISQIVDLIHKADVERQVLLSSINHNYLIEALALAPEITTGALQEEQHPDNLIDYLQQLGVSAYHPEASLCNPAMVSALNAANIAVNVFTVNDPVHKQTLFDMGVRSIFTDFL